MVSSRSNHWKVARTLRRLRLRRRQRCSLCTHLRGLGREVHAESGNHCDVGQHLLAKSSQNIRLLGHEILKTVNILYFSRRLELADARIRVRLQALELMRGEFLDR